MTDPLRHDDPETCFLAIAGGGAAGLTAAIAAATVLRELDQTSRQQISSRFGLGHTLDIVILEKNDRVGRKILVTGNGRCNLSNQDMDLRYFHGQSVSFAQGALRRFSLEQTIEWFSQIGLPCRTEPDGRIFPNSLQAAAVLDILRQEAERLGIIMKTGWDVEAVKPLQPLFIGSQRLRDADGFLLKSKDGSSMRAGLVIAATGGLAAPALGCDGRGYDFFVSAGHKLISPFPALVQIKTDTSWSKGLAGSKFEGRVSTWISERQIRQEQGEILFTQYGLSGPPIIQLSRVVAAALADPAAGAAVRIELDFLPHWTRQECVDWLTKRQQHNPPLPLSEFLCGLIPKKIGQALLKQSLDCSLSRGCGELDHSEKQLIADWLKQTQLTATGTLGWDQAQTTAGGLDVSDFRPDTMESKRQPGLYAAGEILDIDGDCGGYNLQWAWSSGCIAGRSAVFSAVRQKQQQDLPRKPGRKKR